MPTGRAEAEQVQALSQHLDSLYARENSLATAAVSLGAASLLVAGFLVTQDPCNAAETAEAACGALDLRMYQLLPLVPLALYSMFLFLMGQATLLGAYMRNVERHIADTNPLADLNLTPSTTLPVPSIARLNMHLYARGKGISALRGVFLAFSVLTTVLLLGLVAVLVVKARGAMSEPRWWEVAAPWAVYGAAVVASLVGLRAVSTRSRLFYRVARRFLEEEARHPEDLKEWEKAESNRRNLSGANPAGYLLLPKGASLLKVVWGAWGVPAAAVLGGWPAVWRGALIAIVLEAVLVQGRYVINDLRDLVFDLEIGPTHSRFPLPFSRGYRWAAIASVIGRAALGWWLLSLLSTPTVATILVSSLLAITALYEAARDVGRRRWRRQRADASRLGELRVPRRVETWAVYSLLGLGYGLRVAAPVAALAAPVAGLPTDWSAAATLAVAVAAVIGTVAGVGVTWGGWVKEATQFVSYRDGKFVASSALRGKAHLVSLARRLGLLTDPHRHIEEIRGTEEGKRFTLTSLYNHDPWAQAGKRTRRIARWGWVPPAAAAVAVAVSGKQFGRSWMAVAVLALGATVQGWNAFSGTRCQDLRRRHTLEETAKQWLLRVWNLPTAVGHGIERVFVGGTLSALEEHAVRGSKRRRPQEADRKDRQVWECGEAPQDSPTITAPWAAWSVASGPVSVLKARSGGPSSAKESSDDTG